MNRSSELNTGGNDGIYSLSDVDSSDEPVIRAYKNFQLQTKGSIRELTSDFMNARELFAETGRKLDMAFELAVNKPLGLVDSSSKRSVSTEHSMRARTQHREQSSKSPEASAKRKRAPIFKRVASRLMNHKQQNNTRGWEDLKTKLRDQQLE